MARIIERKTADGRKRFTAQIRTGGTTQAKTFSTKTDAKAWARKREVEIREKPHLGTEAGKHTLAEAVARYERDILSGQSAAARRDRLPILAGWVERFGPLPLSQIQPPAIAAARDELLRTPRQFGPGTLMPATVAKRLRVLSHLYTIARKEWHWVRDNPVAAVTMPRVDNARTRFLATEGGADSELSRLLAACRNSPSEFLYEVVLLTMTTAARKAEVMGLTWNDVDLEREVVIYRDTKNGTTRTATITTDLVETFRARQGERGDLIFPSPHDVTRPVDLRSSWENAVRFAGIKDFRFHDLRHTGASYAAMSGASTAELAGLLGHKTLSMVARYAHLSEAHVAKASAMVGNHIAEALDVEG